jgi:ABC-type nitrate/sulfonate/bicarbonate transport system ATPase subunit
MIQIKKAYLQYPSLEFPTIDIEDLQFTWTGISTLAGPSGSGKTSLFRLLAGWFEPSENSLCDFGGHHITTNDIRMVGAHASLLPWFTVKKNIILQTKNRLSRPVKKLLQQVGLLNKTGLLYPYELSLGMYKRVELIIAVEQNPKLLFLDELFTSLDDKARSHVKAYINERRNSLMTMISAHEKGLSVSIGDTKSYELVLQSESGTVKGIKLL